MREGSNGAAPWVIVLIMVVLVTVGIFSSLANLLRLDFETLMDVLGWLALIWGSALLLSFVAILMKASWPLCLGLSWLALMPAFRVWFSEEVYAWVDPIWARCVIVLSITAISSKVKSYLQ